MKARLRLPRELLEADRIASQLCRRYQIMPTHSAFMVWRMYDEWKPVRPFPEREQAEEYLFSKLPAIEGER